MNVVEGRNQDMSSPIGISSNFLSCSGKCWILCVVKITREGGRVTPLRLINQTFEKELFFVVKLSFIVNFVAFETNMYM